MTPLEAYRHLSIIIEKINAILSSFIQTDADVIQNNNNENEEKSAANQIIDEDYLERLENKLYFSPAKGNIVFCSATDCWGFRIMDFIDIFSKKLGCNQKVLAKTLWGDFYLNPKTKQISTKPLSEKHKPMFVDFILQNIWNVYEKLQSGDQEIIDKIAKGLGIEIPEKMKENNWKDPQPLIWVA
jgi:ribosome assembly protein 1